MARGWDPKQEYVWTFYEFWVADTLKLLKPSDAGLAHLGILSNITWCLNISAPSAETISPALKTAPERGVEVTGHQAILQKLLKGASPAPAWFWIMTPSLIQKWKETSYIPYFGVPPVLGVWLPDYWVEFLLCQHSQYKTLYEWGYSLASVLHY